MQKVGENRFLYRCPKCDMPMLEKVGSKLLLLQHYKGQRVKTEIERDLIAPTNKLTIRCGSCKEGAQTFLHFTEIIRMGESTSAKVVEVGSVV